MAWRDKIIPLQDLVQWRRAMREAGQNLGDLLLVGLNSDSSVRELKGADRPINPESDRAGVLAALASVDAVCIFPERGAAAFLAKAQPDVYVKGGDYTIDTLNPEEREIVERAGGVVHVLPVAPGRSTTELLKKISRL
jgi:D-glycero-beta-D-manno-heptose 1-phosphate adenylyltransferase